MPFPRQDPDLSGLVLLWVDRIELTYGLNIQAGEAWKAESGGRVMLDLLAAGHSCVGISVTKR